MIPSHASLPVAEIDETLDSERPEFCRFCGELLRDARVTSTDQRQSHPACYAKWCKQVAAEFGH